MRPNISAAVAHDVSRLCARCRLQASRASPPSLSLSRNAAIASQQQLQQQHLAARTQPPALLQRRAYSSSSSSSSSSNSPQPDADAAASSPSSKPSPPKTHYDLFPSTLPDGPPPAGHFPVDLRALRREFLQLQARAHPDMHPSAAKARAEATSALINEAYRTLSNPLLRAQYLLSLRGVDVATDETLKVEEPDLLMLVLEAREEIEDAEEETDLEEPRRVNDARIAESEQQLEDAFKRDDVEAAKREAVRLRYWVNIKESLDNWERGKPIVLEH